MSRPVQLVGPKRFLVTSFRLLLLAVVLNMLTGDQLSDAADRLSFRTVSQFIDFDDDARRHAAEKIGVILIDQPSLNNAGRTWPPSYGFHAQMLSYLLPRQPKAVFLDLIFVDDRPDESLGLLVEVLRAYQEEDIPVYAAAANPAEYPGRPIRKELQPFVQLVAGWTDRSERDGSVYDAVANEKDHASMPAPAFAMYREACRRGEQPACAADIFKDDARPLWVTWPHRQPDYPAIFGPLAPGRPLPVKCGTQERPPSLHLGSLFQIFSPSTGVAYSCGPNLSLPAFDVMIESPNSLAAYVDLFRDRYVFYGYQLEGLQDYVHPVTTTKPIGGVFLHAQALENLLAYDARYLSNEAMIRWITADWMIYVALFLAHFGLPLLAISLGLIGIRSKLDATQVAALRREYFRNPHRFAQEPEPVTDLRPWLRFRFAGIGPTRYSNPDSAAPRRYHILRKALRLLKWVGIAAILMAAVILGPILLDWMQLEILRIAPINWLQILTLTLPETGVLLAYLFTEYKFERYVQEGIRQGVILP